MFDKILTLAENINAEELREFIIQKETLIEDIDKILEWLSYEKDKRNIEFVHGISKRKTAIQKWIEQLSEYKERQKNIISVKPYSRIEIVILKLIQMRLSCV